MDKLPVKQAIIVEGRDDVNAVETACDALVIATHGYGISAETWSVIDKAYAEKGLIILTDPDHAGEEIRRRISEKYPGGIHAYLDRDDAKNGGDIGVENASSEVIAEAIEKALGYSERTAGPREASRRYADMNDLIELGLAASEDAAARRAEICKILGIGYSNASGLIKKLKGFGIDSDELKKAASKVK